MEDILQLLTCIFFILTLCIILDKKIKTENEGICYEFYDKNNNKIIAEYSDCFKNMFMSNTKCEVNNYTYYVSEYKEIKCN